VGPAYRWGRTAYKPGRAGVPPEALVLHFRTHAN
jgi:hypothetical protein